MQYAALWAGILTVLLVAAFLALWRSGRLELQSKLSLGDFSNIVSVLLAVFAIAFTLAAQQEPRADLVVKVTTALQASAPQVFLNPSRRASLSILRSTSKIYFLIENRGNSQSRGRLSSGMQHRPPSDWIALLSSPI